MHSAHKEFMHPGLRLRQARERLGLTYREVESASHELAARRGRSEFILRYARLTTATGRQNMTGPCILSNYAMDTVVDGSTRMVRGS
jgi:hypothetical protein